MKLIAIFALVFVLTSGPRDAISQQEGPPAGMTAIDCAVDPMPQERIDELAALAIASPETGEASTAPFVPEGVDVPMELRSELQAAFYLYQACSATGDLPRLFALFTDRYVVEYLATHGPIQHLSPNGTPTGGTVPPGATDQERFIMGGVLMADERIAVKVGSNAWGGNPRLYVFEKQGGRWLIDEIATYTGMMLIEPDDPVETSDDA